MPTSTAAKYSTNRLWNVRSILFGAALGIIVSLTAVTIAPIQSKGKCTRNISTWSPALGIYDDVDWDAQRFNGKLHGSSKYHGAPTQAMNDAWDELTYPEGGMLRLSGDQLERIQAPEYAATYPEEMGGGYMAGIEVFHQLHCLNMLRKATYMDYYFSRNQEWVDDPVTYRLHLDHCVNMLRQKLMCNPDLGMITYAWVKGLKQVFPDFNTVHQCRPYSKVLDWAREHSVHTSMNVSDIHRAAGALEKEIRP